MPAAPRVSFGWWPGALFTRAIRITRCPQALSALVLWRTKGTHCCLQLVQTGCSSPLITKALLVREIHRQHTVSTSSLDCQHIITTLSARHHQTVGTSSPHCQHVTTRLSAHHHHTVSTSLPDCRHITSTLSARHHQTVITSSPS
ncbi:uncharacterized protein LOC126988687 isoform X2 [Eriocheir sinensis]|uniref:uncharacterized protein LOC126988687 isoform X2 n=1 Tax=Eriocheir sinensis TaxID=95602 RepID=UPI0021CA923D|nr:uncharacterized protein LOC126988687 isoform X2 [Eriocheir sinensis]XP_050703000.1 uncharacterized protein LOC126988687 isoform X2 [Eriocheir sinensis]